MAKSPDEVLEDKARAIIYGSQTLNSESTNCFPIPKQNDGKSHMVLVFSSAPEAAIASAEQRVAEKVIAMLNRMHGVEIRDAKVTNAGQRTVFIAVPTEELNHWKGQYIKIYTAAGHQF